MFDDMAGLLVKQIDPSVASMVQPEDYVEAYITRTGLRILFVNPGFILEFESHVASTVALIRYILVDLARMFTILVSLRYFIQFLGFNPFDGGFMEVIYTFTQPYIRFFLGYFPNILGIDGGLFVSFYLLERVETLLLALIIIDPAGNRY